ncbi:protein FAM214A-like isoform X3 [Acanthaster planci]|nr:protein FAM214A-like isoform X2 [Acanthaster planci]XP_022088474.1 protein FAM214A-like isoform X3 [Acanthaster planci]
MIAGAGLVTPSGVGLMGQVPDDLEVDDDPRPEPNDLFVDFGMLILEGRKPERSVKGRVEGEHCPPRYPNEIRHRCAPDRVARCKQIEAARSYICFLCLNNIPMSIEVLLYPDCCREGEQAGIEMTSTSEETAQTPDQPSPHLLLEQWIIQLLPKRFPDGHSHSHLLFQAVRSFLHFSQISAWLSSTQGRLPKNIVYRVCAPGESFPTSFSSTPEVHTFPILNLSKSSSLRVTVASLPRSQSIPALPCYNAAHSAMGRAARKGGSDRDAEDDDREFSYSFVDPSRERDQRSGEELKEERRQKQDQKTMHVSSGAASSDQEELARQGSATAAQKLRVLLPEPKDTPPFHPEQKGHKLPKLRDSSPQHVRRRPLRPTTCDNLPQRPASSEKFEEKPPTSAKLRCQQAEESSKGKHTPTYELYYTSGQPSFSTVELERRIQELKLQKLERSSSSSPECVTSTPPPSRGESTPRPICAWRDRTPSLEEDDGIFFTAKSSLEDRGFAVQDVHRTSHREDEDVPSTEFGTPLSTVPWLSYQKSTDSDSGNQGHTHCESQAESVFVGNQPKHGFSGTDIPTSFSQSNARKSNFSPQTPEMQSPHCPYAIGGAEPTGNNALSNVSQQPSQPLTTQNQRTTIDHVQGAYTILGCSPCQNQANQSPSASAVSGNTPSPTSSPRHARRRGFSLDSHDFQANIPAPFRKPLQYEGSSENTTSVSSPFTPVFGRSKSLFKSILGKENNARSKESLPAESGEATTPPTLSGLRSGLMRRSLDSSNTYVFNPSTGLPINSSPAPLRKAKTEQDCASLLKPRSLLKSSPSCNDLENSNVPLSQATRVFSTSAPASTSCLLGNFEESVLNGRLEPLGTIDGFTAEIGASGSFCPKHITLPVTTFFYSVSDDDAPSSYFGYINLEHLGRRGYHIPKVGTIQATLFNPNKTVVKMFVMRYNLSDMPPNCQTFARQRIYYMPSNAQLADDCEKELRYLIHIRFQSSKSGKIYLHTDIRMIFARHSPDLESALGTYELRSFTETPTNPRFSPKKR